MQANRPTPRETDLVRRLRERLRAEGGTFWADPDMLCVFDADAARRMNAENYADLTLPDRLVDLLRGRSSPKVSWKTVRAAWSDRLRELSEPAAVAALDERMARLLDRRLGRPLDLGWALQEVFSRALIPTVIDGLPEGDVARVERDQDLKLELLLVTAPVPRTWRGTLRSFRAQIGAGRAVRRELRGRARGRRPRRLDLADPIVDLLSELGMDRAVDAVTAVLTAIAGPPGCAATFVAYELLRDPGLAERLATELAPLTPEDLAGASMRAAPETHRFVKEILRLWSPPILMSRPVRTAVDLDGVRAEEGQRYLLSTFFIHHDPRYWQDPERFDPDRWRPGADHGPCPGAGTYVPFGWSPKSCIGAGLGTTQLLLLCHQLTTRYRLRPNDPDAVRPLLGGVPMVTGFEGTIERAAG